MQRIWLTATSLGLHLQPEMTPVNFRWYSCANRSMSALPEIDRRMRTLASGFEALTTSRSDDHFAFFCRISIQTRRVPRSLRMNLDELMVRQAVSSREDLQLHDLAHARGIRKAGVANATPALFRRSGCRS